MICALGENTAEQVGLGSTGEGGDGLQFWTVWERVGAIESWHLSQTFKEVRKVLRILQYPSGQGIEALWSLVTPGLKTPGINNERVKLWQVRNISRLDTQNGPTEIFQEQRRWEDSRKGCQSNNMGNGGKVKIHFILLFFQLSVVLKNLK